MVENADYGLRTRIADCGHGLRTRTADLDCGLGLQTRTADSDCGLGLRTKDGGLQIADYGKIKVRPAQLYFD